MRRNLAVPAATDVDSQRLGLGTEPIGTDGMVIRLAAGIAASLLMTQHLDRRGLDQRQHRRAW
jgi:hypothetical protein